MFKFFDSAGFTWDDSEVMHLFGEAQLGEISSPSIESVTKKLDISEIYSLSN